MGITACCAEKRGEITIDTVESLMRSNNFQALLEEHNTFKRRRLVNAFFNKLDLDRNGFVNKVEFMSNFRSRRDRKDRLEEIFD